MCFTRRLPEGKTEIQRSSHTPSRTTNAILSVSRPSLLEPILWVAPGSAVTSCWPITRLPRAEWAWLYGHSSAGCVVLTVRPFTCSSRRSVLFRWLDRRYNSSSSLCLALLVHRWSAATPLAESVPGPMPGKMDGKASRGMYDIHLYWLIYRYRFSPLHHNDHLDMSLLSHAPHVKYAWTRKIQ